MNLDRQTTKRIALFLALVALVSWQPRVALAQQTDIVDPATLGFDVAKLKKIDVLMKRGIKDGKLVGCSAMILKDDQICYYQQWGAADEAKERDLNRDDIFRIYSMSKPITSVAAMQLVEQGKMELDDEVGKYIPSLANLKVLQSKDGGFVEVEARRAMTVRDLMRHSSGLTYGFFGNSEVDQRYRRSGILIRDLDLASMAKSLGKLPLKHHPGDQFEYSVSTDVLGYLVEVVSGQPFDEYLKSNLFEPLKMNDTSFVVPSEKLDRLAEMYRADNSGNLVPAPKFSSIRFVNQANRFYSGGGGLCSTIDDYKQFCRMLINDGKLNDKQIIRPESLEQMWTNQLGDLKKKSRSFQFGLGFSIAPEGDYAWGGAAGTRFWVNPDKNLAIIFMVQINPYRARYGEKMRSIVYDALK